MIFLFFTDTATTEIYTLSLHDALPIYPRLQASIVEPVKPVGLPPAPQAPNPEASSVEPNKPDQPKVEPSKSVVSDRKSTRLNSSHMSISYAVFCLKKKNK